MMDPRYLEEKTRWLLFLLAVGLLAAAVRWACF